MPIKPGKSETQSEWMERCVPEMMGDGKRPQDQAVAACLTMWRDRKDLDVVRSWSTLTIKELSDDDDARQIKGVASTPTTDRMGDVVESLGLKFTKEIPLLFAHRHDQPVGVAKLDKPTEDGVTFTATLAKIAQDGDLKRRVDDVWQMIKAGLIRGVSIGFKALEFSFMKDGGIHFQKAEVVELSLVTIPANVEATIHQVKSYDAVSSAASGNGAARPTSGVADKSHEERKMKTVAEQISAFDARRKAANDRMTELMNKAAEEGVTLDQAESDEYDNLEVDIKKLNDHIERLIKLEEHNKAAAKPIQVIDIASGSEARSSSRDPVIRVRSNVPPGIRFTRYVMLMAASNGNRHHAREILSENKTWMSETPELAELLKIDVNYYMKAAVNPGTAVEPAWAGPLVVATNLASEFAEFLRPLTIIGRIGNLRRVPFNISLPRATAGTSVGWVGEGAPKPVTSMAFDTVTLRWAKAAAIVVLTEELVRHSNPAAESVVRSDLASAMTFFLDRQFVDPSVAEVTNVSPASITNGVTPITATGTTAAAFRADVASLFASLFAANLSTAGGVWIMTQLQALKLSLMQNSLGQQVFPSVNPDSGGTLLGYPVVQSENMPAVGGSPADGYPLIFAIGPEIMLADDGQILIDASREASLQMDTAPDSPPSASTNMVSLWQTNMLGLRAERWINWKKRRTAAVQYISNAKYAE